MIFSDSWPRSITIEIEHGDFYRERSKKTGKLGGPLMPCKNRAHGTTATGGKYVTARQKHFRNLIRAHCARLETGLGPYALTVEQTCRQMRKVGGIEFPQPDSDACLSAVRDAIQARPYFRGLVADDAQILDNTITSRLSTAKPRVCGLRIELQALRVE